jgi:hypothetical protein
LLVRSCAPSNPLTRPRMQRIAILLASPFWQLYSISILGRHLMFCVLFSVSMAVGSASSDRCSSAGHPVAQVSSLASSRRVAAPVLHQYLLCRPSGSFLLLYSREPRSNPVRGREKVYPSFFNSFLVTYQ